MFRLSRTSVIAWAAVVAVIAASSYALTVVAVPRAAAEGNAKEDRAKKAAPVEFTDDSKLKRPVGYREWVYVGEVITPSPSKVANRCYNDMGGSEIRRQ